MYKAKTLDNKEVKGWLIKSDIAKHCFIVENCTTYYNSKGEIRISNMHYSYVKSNTIEKIEDEND